MSHYPSSAELASFRLTIAQHARGYQQQRPPDPLHPVDIHPHRGAWPDERASGIGHGNGWAYAETWHNTYARREAARMRSRAFVKIAPTWPQGHGWHADHFGGACAMERCHGMPAEVSHYRP